MVGSISCKPFSPHALIKRNYIEQELSQSSSLALDILAGDAVESNRHSNATFPLICRTTILCDIESLGLPPSFLVFPSSLTPFPARVDDAATSSDSPDRLVLSF